MQYKSDGDTYIISVEQNESVMETLTEFSKEHAIKNGQLSGIGAISDIEIGAYDLGTQEYTRTLFKDTWELVSFQGNILLKDNEPFVHAHVQYPIINLRHEADTYSMQPWRLWVNSYFEK